MMEQEVKNFNIKLSDLALSKIIKNERTFKIENKFSRAEYEKFLIKNNLSAPFFEANISNKIKKEKLMNFIGGGIVPPNFLINDSYNKINQKRKVELIDLNKIFNKEIKFSENEIESYYNKNKKCYELSDGQLQKVLIDIFYFSKFYF